MDLASLLLFAGVYFAAVATPGPGFALIVARSLAKGLDGLPFFILGFLLGDLTLLVLAATGLAFVAQTFAGAFLVVKYAGAAYLLYLAWKIWRAPAAPLEAAADAVPEGPGRAFLSSYLLTIGNPKVIVFFLSIMPLVVDLHRMGPIAFAEMAAVIVVVLVPVLTTVALLADRARRVFRSSTAVRRMQRGTALTMGGVAVAVAAR
ncbi:LysE family translocator [Antarcticirhabdus aurantiaca]|uniref:LysE family translocator n=1 Tax=Antarcticirhabdus aurantiaca TaxID=2606717 RepID=A0ACD4NV80_9HYPH|nr:LysE family translocator [Antarcticirhabdus aurantiaca]WAJ30454.1 LysE family translocator [Jeongeuplla avenae]